MIKCPDCGRDSADGEAICGGCGRALAAYRACPRCGNTNHAANKSCDRCGCLLTDQGVSSLQTAASSFANGRYRVLRLLGEGGMKRVYLARDTVLDREIALALIKSGGLEEENRSRFVREAKLMGQLGHHPNIISVYDLGEEAGQPYMITELVSGDSLGVIIERAPEHRLSIQQTIDIAKSVCRALAAVHAHGIIHRDLKPGNVYLGRDGTVKIGDFDE